MGHLQASEMARLAPNLDAALHWHLTSNHFPSLPTALIPVAKRAIRYAKRGEWNRNLRMPKDITFRKKTTATVQEIVESMHLDAFLG